LFGAGTIFDSFVYIQRTTSATCQSSCCWSCYGLPWYWKYLTSPHRYVHCNHISPPPYHFKDLFSLFS